MGQLAHAIGQASSGYAIEVVLGAMGSIFSDIMTVISNEAAEDPEGATHIYALAREVLEALLKQLDDVEGKLRS
jgi:hypothetical protein